MSGIKNGSGFSSSRRKLIVGAALGAASFGYITHRGLRFPRLTFSPDEPLSAFTAPDAVYTIKDAIFANIHTADSTSLELRAITPEPKVSVTLNGPESSFSITNVAATANLTITSGSVKADISEVANGLTRTVTIKHLANESIELHWRFDDQRVVNFAVIGDSGGGDELPWCLSRAAQLGAEFLLHLGDFNYRRGEYDSAIQAFKNAAIPTYVTIGNHDFNDSGLVYEQYLDQVGYFNNRFTVAGTDFLNIDTSADFFPTKGGQRGRFIRNLVANDKPKIAFSHRPFIDVRPGEDHGMANKAEERYLHETLTRLACEDYLCGHVHKSGETDVDGLNQWTVGEGLGYEDWVARRSVSQLLLGRLEPETKPQFTWASLDMPWSVHTSPEHLEKLLKEQPQDAIDWYYKTRTLHAS